MTDPTIGTYAGTYWDHEPQPYYERDGLRIFHGDCRDVLAALEPESVSCCITSPPFWGLRKYDCPPSVWGGSPECSHTLDAQPMSDEGYASRKRWQHDGVSRQETPEAWVKEVHVNTRLNDNTAGAKQRSNSGSVGWRNQPRESATCSLCGAWRGWLGLEPTAEMYVEHIVEVLRLIQRVLRKDGVLWLDIDDSRGGQPSGNPVWKNWTTGGTKDASANYVPRAPDPGIPAKSLCLIPERIALAALADGWIVRSVIVIPSWMPESARDRPTDAYRRVLMLVKTKRYWYDAEAVKVRQADSSVERAQYGWAGCTEDGSNGAITGSSYRRMAESGEPMVTIPKDGLRNLGNIWSDIPPAAFPMAHFATYAIEEPERAILASCPAEVCSKCGKARVRLVEKANVREHSQREGRKDRNKADFDGQDYASRESGLGLTWDAQTIGWSDCDCGAPFVPGTVLDPFLGSGTTALAAQKLGRRCIGIEASETYIKEQVIPRLAVGDAGIRRMVKAERAGAKQETLLL